MFRDSSAESEHTGHHDPDHEDWDTASDSAMAAGSLNLELKITDAEVITALSAHTPGREQRDFALTALRIGVLALRQAQGLVDADTVKHEGERLLNEMGNQLSQHRERVTADVGKSLQDYFDPDSGRFNERVNRLLKKDGELETVLRRQLGEQDSELARTLTAYVGDASPLMKVLDPEASSGLLQNLRGGVDEALKENRERIVSQFSLDSEDSALSRLLAKITDSNGELTKELQGSVAEVVKEFSLDSEDSALSRLVNQVDRAQKQISAEFSLDEDSSALARMKGELLKVLGEHADKNRNFQEEVRTALEAMKVRKDESQRSTTHGGEFEDQLFAVIQRKAQAAGDIAAHVGDSTGLIRHNKKGDITVELGPEHAAAGSKLVIEAKQDASYNLARARAEIDEARRNREAETGLFVFSSRTAPAGLESLARYGNDVIVVWDAEDERTDVWLDAAVTLAKALCTRAAVTREAQTADFEAIDSAIREIEKQAGGLDEITKWTETIRSSSDKILKKVDVMSRKLERQIENLDEGIDDLRHVLNNEGD